MKSIFGVQIGTLVGSCECGSKVEVRKDFYSDCPGCGFAHRWTPLWMAFLKENFDRKEIIDVTGGGVDQGHQTSLKTL